MFIELKRQINHFLCDTAAVILCSFAPPGQFKSRANPSAGMVPFLRSQVCNFKNLCKPMDDYEDIPTYDGSMCVKNGEKRKNRDNNGQSGYINMI